LISIFSSIKVQTSIQEHHKYQSQIYFSKW